MKRVQAYTTVRADICEMVPKSAKNILDIGCSNGALGANLKIINNNRCITGIEYSQNFIHEAENQIDHVICADIAKFDWNIFEPEQFDCIIFADILEHMQFPEAILAAVIPHLSKEGCIVLSMPNIRHVSALWSIAIKGTFPQRDRGIFDRTHLRWFTISDTKKMLSSQGIIIDAESFALRIGDQGGGFSNRAIQKILDPFANVGAIREFLSYQFCFRGRKEV